MARIVPEVHKKQIRYGSLVSRWKDGGLLLSGTVCRTSSKPK